MILSASVSVSLWVMGGHSACMQGSVSDGLFSEEMKREKIQGDLKSETKQRSLGSPTVYWRAAAVILLLITSFRDFITQCFCMSSEMDMIPN